MCFLIQPFPRLHTLLHTYTGAVDALALYMWRSNALRLRHCSSTAAARNGLNIRRYGSESSLPISEDEFARALGVVFPWTWKQESKETLGMEDLEFVGAFAD